MTFYIYAAGYGTISHTWLSSTYSVARVTEKEMATPSHILAWRISWTEEPGRLQSTGLQRVGHD